MRPSYDLTPQASMDKKTIEAIFDNHVKPVNTNNSNTTTTVTSSTAAFKKVTKKIMNVKRLFGRFSVIE